MTTTSHRARLSTLRPADLFALPVVLGTMLEFGLGQLFSPYNTRGHLFLTALLQLLTVCVAFAFLTIIFLALRGLARDEVLRLALLACIPIAAALGGLFLGAARASAALDEPGLLPVRVTTTLMHVSAVALLLWLAVSGIRLHYARLDVLTHERDRLQALEQQARQTLAALDEAATEAVRSRILASLTGASAGAAKEVLAALTSTLEDIVRPLSRQLESQSDEWVPPPTKLTKPQRIDWKAAALDGMDPRLLSPFWIIVILNLFGAPMNFGRSGPLFGLQFILISFCVAWPLFSLIRRLVVSRMGSDPGGGSIAWFVVACVSGGLVLACSMLPLTLGGPQPFRFVYLAPAFTLITGFVWGFAVAAQRQAARAEAELRAVTLDLRWQIARSRELHRQRRRALAHAVHGQIQAALAAGILELASTLRDGSVTETAVRDVQLRVIACVEELDLRHVQPSALDVLLAKVQATWAGLAHLTLALDQTLVGCLQEDGQCLVSLNDLIPELTFNSIRHGAATEIHVRLTRIDKRTVCLEVSDNGQPATDGARNGMGSRLLDESTLDWHRTRIGGSTVTTALLPLSASAVTPLLPLAEAIEVTETASGDAGSAATSGPSFKSIPRDNTQPAH